MEMLQEHSLNAIAMVGGQAGAAFKIQESAVAFRTMSDSLYRDKELAVARELIINAWDSQITAGTTDKPLKISISEDEFRVEDQGTGIPHDQIIEVFCTLFGSTKRGDGSVSGKFGLGAKAPFSISDHFTVTNYHGGRQIVYAMHLGDDSSQGIPMCRPMSSGPTDKTGLVVSVPLSGQEQATKIAYSSYNVVRDGGVRAMIADPNHHLCRVLEEAPRLDVERIRSEGFALRKVVPSSHSYGDSRAHVLFGSILYPLDAHVSLDRLIMQLEQFKAPGYGFIIAAPPNSIQETPSRESLSYNKPTLATLQRLLTRTINRLKQESPHARNRIIDRMFDGVTRDKLARFFSNIVERPALKEMLACGATECADLFWDAKIPVEFSTSEKISKLFRSRFAAHRDLLQTSRFQSYQVDARNLEFRKLVKILSRCDLLHNFYWFNGDCRLLHLRESGKNAQFPINELIVIAPTKSELYRHKASVGTGLALLRDKSVTDDQIARFTKLADAAGYEVKVLERLAPIKRLPKPKVDESEGVAWHPFEFIGYSRFQQPGCRIVDSQIMKPSAIVPHGLIKKDGELLIQGVCSGVVKFAMNEVKKEFGRVALAYNATEWKRAQKMGLPSVYQLLTERLEGAIADLECDDEELAFDFMLTEFAIKHFENKYDKIKQKTAKVIMWGRREAYVLFDRPYVPCPKRDRVFQLMKLERSLDHLNGGYSRSYFAANEVNIAIAKELKDLREVSDYLAKTIKSSRRLSNIKGKTPATIEVFSMNILNDFCRHDEVIAVLEFLNDRYNSKIPTAGV
jgi:hypothetical protein